MEEEKRLPRNIRQIGETEDNVRVYLEDYAYTFIRKLDVRRESRAGILLGSREMAEGKQCFFLRGAVELEGLIREDGIHFSEETWKAAETEISSYFSECSICGWFIRAKEDTGLNRNLLKKVHEQVFAEEDCLMYLREDENDCFWLGEGGSIRKLRGYCVYYERNFQMQNYMLSCRERPESETVNDRAAQNFRKIMKSRQKEKQTQPAVWTQIATAAAVAVIFVGSLYLIGQAVIRQNRDSQVPAFAVGASVERESPEAENGGMEPESGTGGKRANRGSTESGMSGSESTDGGMSDNESAGSGTSDRESAGSKNVNGDRTDDSTEKNTESEKGTAEYPDRAANTDEMEADGKAAGNKSSEPDIGGLKIDLPTLRFELETGTQGSQEADLTAGAETVQSAGTNEAASVPGSEETVQAQAVAGTRYVIQPGDTLAQLSIRFYGTTDMIPQICEKNGISNPNTIFIGQEIELP